VDGVWRPRGRVPRVARVLRLNVAMFASREGAMGCRRSFQFGSFAAWARSVSRFLWHTGMIAEVSEKAICLSARRAPGAPREPRRHAGVQIAGLKAGATRNPPSKCEGGAPAEAGPQSPASEGGKTKIAGEGDLVMTAFRARGHKRGMCQFKCQGHLRLLNLLSLRRKADTGAGTWRTLGRAARSALYN
jgi:hypothetical protein